MTNEERSPKEIEREIEREREGLTKTLDELQDKFSIDTVVRQVSDQFRENGGDIARSVSRSVKDNPVALALTGVGLAWMIFGSGARGDRRYDQGDNGYRSSDRRGTGYDYDDDDYDETRHGYRGSRTHMGRAKSSGLRRAQPSDPYYDGPYASDDLPPWARNPDNYEADDGLGVGERLRDAAEHVKDKASAAASSVRQRAGEFGSTVSDTTAAAGASAAAGAKSVSDASRSLGGSVKSGLTDAFSTASDRAAAMRERLAQGTENLTVEARSRVIAARQKAVEARRSAIVQARRGSERASDLFEEQPLVAGALALAVGAAIGAALPRTRVEDDYLGEQSDTLMQEAERVFAEEKEKLTKVAGAAKAEAKQIADEVKSDAHDAAGQGKTVADAVADKAKSSAKRVADTAKAEADKLGVGKPKT